MTKSFGERLRKLMKSRGMKAITLAQKMGVSCAYVSQLMTGIRNPGRETLLKLSKALNVPLETLLAFDSDIADRGFVSRRIPVLDKAHMDTWVDYKDLDYPASVTHRFEYATTDDPHAFYITSEGLQLCCGLDFCDLILVEPSKKISNGDTVFVRSASGVAIKKIAIKDKLAVLIDETNEPFVITPESSEEGLRVYRISQCIRKF